MEGIGRLAGGVAHDFNNLLSAISGFGTLAAMKTAEGHPALPYLSQIDGLVRRAANLTQQLLAFSRRQMFEPKVIDLNELLSGMEKMLGPLLGEDVGLVLVKDPQLGHVRVDPGQMEQIVVNLCVNAKDAMPKGGQITVVTRNTVLDAADAVEISFRDTGTGIEPEVLSKIFEPFFTTKERGRGTGLGLATCYGIVKQSGGQIFVDSVLGIGTTFHVVLPRAHDEIQALKVPAVPGGISSGTETLLVVEDDPDVSQATAGLLGEMGYVVLVARSSDEALDHIAADESRAIRLVLTDVVMPGRNGKELADEILVKRPDLPVLFTSGYTDDAILRQGIEESEVEFLRKPFTPYALSSKIREILDREPKR
jgi:CheY-like chemotaxis protein